MMLPKFAKVSPALFILFGAVCAAHGIARAALVPATQVFLDRAMDFTGHKIDLPGVIAGLVLLTAAHVCRQLVHGVHHVLMITYWRKAEGVFSLEIHKKTDRLPPVVFEDTQRLDDINKAMQGKDEAVWFTGNTFTIFTFYLPYFSFMAVYFTRVNPSLILLLGLVFAPTLLSHVFKTKVFARAEDKAAPVRREFDYYELCMTGREYFKETRILGAFPFFKKMYAESLALLNGLLYRASVKSGMGELSMKLLSLCGYVGSLLLLFNLLMKGEISVGALAAIFSSMEMVFSLMKEFICDNLGESAKDLSRVQNYLRFLQMPERECADKGAARVDKDAPVYTEKDARADIILRGVSFSYPGANQKAVDGVTLTVGGGETVAVVGENGSGKTTLVRLITGLYEPDEGDVFFGGANTKEVSASTLFRNISAVFQKYQRYQMTMRENIGISDTCVITADAEFDKICAQAGIDINDGNYTDGIDTMLSREFDGVDLSGGQWQRVAIARGFFRSRPVIVLDEPTAAIDPIEETKIYGRFAEIAKNKTSVIITHRLGSVKLADRILVMKQGKLAEQGTHGELLAAGGEYARLYKSQEQWYL